MKQHRTLGDEKTTGRERRYWHYKWLLQSKINGNMINTRFPSGDVKNSGSSCVVMGLLLIFLFPLPALSLFIYPLDDTEDCWCFCMSNEIKHQFDFFFVIHPGSGISWGSRCCTYLSCEPSIQQEDEEEGGDERKEQREGTKGICRSERLRSQERPKGKVDCTWTQHECVLPLTAVHVVFMGMLS